MPDGGRFAHLAGPMIGDDRIVIVRTDGRVERQWSPGGKLNRIRWSPDGNSFAVTSGGEGPGQGVVLEVLSLGDETRRTVATKQFLSYTVWAPDGRSVYYRGANTIERVDIATGAVTLVFAPKKPVGIERFASFDLSPDGEWLAVPVRTATARCAIQLVSRNGTGLSELAHFPTDCHALAWTHDQQAVLISTSGPNWTSHLWMVPSGGGPAVPIPSDDVQINDMTFHPRGGGLLLLSIGNPRPDFWTLSGFARSAN